MRLVAAPKLRRREARAGQGGRGKFLPGGGGDAEEGEEGEEAPAGPLRGCGALRLGGRTHAAAASPGARTAPEPCQRCRGINERDGETDKRQGVGSRVMSPASNKAVPSSGGMRAVAGLPHGHQHGEHGPGAPRAESRVMGCGEVGFD